jgi:MFS family permease
MIFPLTEKIGRKYALMVCAAVFQIGSLIQVLAFGHLQQFMQDDLSEAGVLALLALLFLYFLFRAFIDLQIYIAEISPPAIRGRLV